MTREGTSLEMLWLKNIRTMGKVQITIAVIQHHRQRHLEMKKSKSKAVPLHAMKAPGGRGGIAPTHF
jgi:hypothetical protein